MFDVTPIFLWGLGHAAFTWWMERGWFEIWYEIITHRQNADLVSP
jgi:hypothetical protein